MTIQQEAIRQLPIAPRFFITIGIAMVSAGLKMVGGNQPLQLAPQTIQMN